MRFVALSHHWIVRRAHPVWYVCSDSHWISWTFALNYLLMFGLRKRNFKKKSGRKEVEKCERQTCLGSTSRSSEGSLVLKKNGAKFPKRRLSNVVVLKRWDSRADPLSWERLWVCRSGVWCASHREDSFLSEDGGAERTSALDDRPDHLKQLELRLEREVSWFHLRTSPAQLESVSAAKLSNRRWKNTTGSRFFTCHSYTHTPPANVIVWETKWRFLQTRINWTHYVKQRSESSRWPELVGGRGGMGGWGMGVEREN